MNVSNPGGVCLSTSCSKSHSPGTDQAASISIPYVALILPNVAGSLQIPAGERQLTSMLVVLADLRRLRRLQRWVHGSTGLQVRQVFRQHRRHCGRCGACRGGRVRLRCCGRVHHVGRGQVHEARRIVLASAWEHPSSIGEDRHRCVADTDSGRSDNTCGELRARGTKSCLYFPDRCDFCALVLLQIVREVLLSFVCTTDHYHLSHGAKDAGDRVLVQHGSMSGVVLRLPPIQMSVFSCDNHSTNIETGVLISKSWRLLS